jgi:NAD(P)-dependent dehydrogenase (short-subunit alcohol dehydrogenase family)
MSSDTPNRAVLTTGANSGFGLLTAIELARRGFRSFGSVRSHDKADVVAKAAAAAGVDVETVIFDVRDREACRRSISDLPPLWGLVNNAGLNPSGAVVDISDEEADEAADVMFLAPMRLARLVIPTMATTGGGRIVNISSIAGRVGIPLAAYYTGSKFGLEAASDALRIEAARYNVRVILIEPGSFGGTGIYDAGLFTDGLDGVRWATSDYRDSYARFRKITALRAFHKSPAPVVRRIVHAIEHPHPKPRYVVGYDGRLQLTLKTVLPTGLHDRLYRQLLHL